MADVPLSSRSNNRSKLHLHVEQLSPKYLRNAGRRPRTSKRISKSPSNWVGQKKKRERKADKTCAPDMELWKRKSFKTWKTLHWQGDQLGQKGSFRASEESAATSLHRAKQRKPCRGSWCPHLTLSNPRHLPFCWGGQGLSTEATKVWCTITKGVREEAWAHQRSKSSLLGVLWGKGWILHRSFFLCIFSQVARHQPTQASEVGTSQHYHLRLQRQVWMAG